MRNLSSGAGGAERRKVERDIVATFLQQDGGGVARDVVLQVGAPRQPVGQVHGALLPTVEVALSPPVKPGRGEATHKSQLQGGDAPPKRDNPQHY